MEKEESIDLMNVAVDAFNAYSLDIFENTDADTALVGMVVSKKYGQMLVNGPFNNENLIGLMLTVLSGAGRQMGLINNLDHRFICALAKKIYKND